MIDCQITKTKLIYKISSIFLQNAFFLCRSTLANDSFLSVEPFALIINRFKKATAKLCYCNKGMSHLVLVNSCFIVNST